MIRQKISLPQITLVCVTGINYQKSIFALWVSSQKINFGKIKLISPMKPKYLPKNVAHEYTVDNKLGSINDYNKYLIYELWRHIDTSHCLVIQADGYVLNPKMWRKEFLDYDYIGAPWPLSKVAYIDPFGNHQRVGNGGFSLRSKKLLGVPNNFLIPWEVNTSNFYKHMNYHLYSEDINICVHNKHIYELAGCKWAPLEEALKFSNESNVTEYYGEKTFGFHKNLPSIKSRLIQLIKKFIFMTFLYRLRIFGEKT